MATTTSASIRARPISSRSVRRAATIKSSPLITSDTIGKIEYLLPRFEGVMRALVELLKTISASICPNGNIFMRVVRRRLDCHLVTMVIRNDLVAPLTNIIRKTHRESC